ncbi:MAG: CPBP family glutamic-type intramembrane protease [Candidatus Hodarchaeales archaeon]|jgi:membrane protease YdiL (CAAX protease family)
MEKSPSNNTNPVLGYFILAYAITWIIMLPSLLISFDIVKASQEALDLWNTIGTIGIFGPTIAGFIMIHHGAKKLLRSGFAFKQPKAIWYAAAIFPLLMVAIVTSLIFALLDSPLPNPGSEQSEDVSLVSLPVIALVVFVFMFIFALGEEFGWRGYALDPLLERWNATETSLILGVIWALWHLPLFFIRGIGQNTDMDRLGPFYLVNFILITIGLTFIYTWLYTNSESNVFLVLVFHGIANGSAALFNLWDTLESMTMTVILVWVIAISLIIYYGPNSFCKEKKLKSGDK